MKAEEFFYSITTRLIILVFSMLELVHFTIKDLGLIVPNIIVMSIFFWGIYRDDKVFSVKYLLFVSILNEILKGELIGLETIPNLVFFYFISNKRRFFINKPFFVIWVGFMIFSASLFLVKIVLLSLIHKHFFFEEYLLMQLILSIVLYTLMHWIYSHLRLTPSRS